MNEDEDLELQALQRRLEDAFQTTRPRAGFEDELWSKMQARRPVWSRAYEFVSGFIASIREAPAVPAAALAVVLVVALGIGIIARSGVHFGAGGGSTTSGEAPAQAALGSRYAGTFGRLPVPAAAATNVPPKVANPSNDTGAGSSYAFAYTGPVNLEWAGQFTVSLTNAPVYRYFEPSAADANQFASSIGASRQAGGPAILGTYAGSGFVLAVSGTNLAQVREPFYDISPDRSKLPAPGPTPVDTANAFLAAHSLVPMWPYTVATANAADVVRVLYLRQFDLPDGGHAYLVDRTGERYGIEVDLRNGQPLQAFGPMLLYLDVAVYPIISGDQAVRFALATSLNSSASNVPTVRLTSVELVYALATAGDQSFYEPVFLFSGTFTQNGATYVKRVIVPAVGPQ
jgi:hypothetical protein